MIHMCIRIEHLEHGGSQTNCNLVLYHFVTCLGSPTSEPGVIFRRLLKKVLYCSSSHCQCTHTVLKHDCFITCTIKLLLNLVKFLQIKYVCGEPTSLPTVPSHIMECFTDYLERLSVAKSDESGMAVIVIDGADLIKVVT